MHGRDPVFATRGRVSFGPPRGASASERRDGDAPGQREAACPQEGRVVGELCALDEGVHDEEDRVLDAADGGRAAQGGCCEAETDEDGETAAV